MASIVLVLKVLNHRVVNDLDLIAAGCFQQLEVMAMVWLVRASLLFLNSSLILQPTRDIGNFIKKFR